MKIIYFQFVILAIISLFGCKENSGNNLISNESTNFSQSDVDSTELTILIRNVYNWHENNELEDFPYKYKEGQDSIFIGFADGVWSRRLTPSLSTVSQHAPEIGAKAADNDPFSRRTSGVSTFSSYM